MFVNRITHELGVNQSSAGRLIVELHEAVGVAEGGEIAEEVVAADDNRATAIVGMERERVGFGKAVIKEKDNMMLDIVDEAKRRNATGLETKITHHSFGRSKREFAGRIEALRHEFLLEAMLKVVNIKVVIAMEADQVMLIAFVIAEENILAMDRTIVFPPTLGLLDGFALGMVVTGVRNLVLVEIMEHGFLTGHKVKIKNRGTAAEEKRTANKVS